MPPSGVRNVGPAKNKNILGNVVVFAESFRILAENSGMDTGHNLACKQSIDRLCSIEDFVDMAIKEPHIVPILHRCSVALIGRCRPADVRNWVMFLPHSQTTAEIYVA